MMPSSQKVTMRLDNKKGSKTETKKHNKEKATPLIERLRHNDPTLKHVRLNNKRLGFPARKRNRIDGKLLSLAEALRQNRTVSKLELGGNHVANPGDWYVMCEVCLKDVYGGESYEKSVVCAEGPTLTTYLLISCDTQAWKKFAYGTTT